MAHARKSYRAFFEHKEEGKKFGLLRDYIKLFVMNLDEMAVPGHDELSSLENRIPGIARCKLHAYRTTFTQKTDHQLSHKLLQGINEAVAAHNPHLNPGMYKKHTTMWRLHLPNKAINPNATLAGFEQFISNWLVKEVNPIHYVSFQSKDSGRIYTLQPYLSKNGYKLELEIFYSEEGKATKKYKYDSDSKKRVERMLLEGSQYSCWIHSLTGSETINNPQDAITTIEKLEGLFSTYTNSILAAKSDDEKLDIIVAYVQFIEHLSPFEGEVTNTSEILLNYLLDEEELPLTLLVNRHRMATFSHDELVNSVKEGQRIYLELTNNRFPKIYNYSGKEISSSIRGEALPEYKSEIDDFIRFVVEPNLAKLSAKEARNELSRMALSSRQF